MGWFSKGKSGGMMNVIRCDEPEYLVWKWRPAGQGANTTSRENSIRWGSSLRVKDGEVAVFIYKQKGGTLQDFIEGPFDATLKTANFPILSGILGAAYGGDSPFQAEVYFINLAGNVQIKFAVPYFDVIDPRFTDIIVPVAAGGSITFNLTDYRAFVKLNRLIHFSLDDFKNQIRDVVIRRMKEAIANAPADMGFPLVQIDRKIGAINDLVAGKLKTDLEDFGVNLKRLDISRIEPDKESEGWEQLRSITANATIDTIKAQNAINIKNLQDTQAKNAENMAETMRIQREEMQRAQRLQSETNFIGAHTLDQQTDVLKTGAQNLGMMGTMNMGSDSSMNPAGMMTADGWYDEQYGSASAERNEYSTTCAKRQLLRCGERCSEWSVQYAAVAADGAKWATYASDLCLETGYGKLGLRQGRTRAKLPLCSSCTGFDTSACTTNARLT